MTDVNGDGSSTYELHKSDEYGQNVGLLIQGDLVLLDVGDEKNVLHAYHSDLVLQNGDVEITFVRITGPASGLLTKRIYPLGTRVDVYLLVPETPAF